MARSTRQSDGAHGVEPFPAAAGSPITSAWGVIAKTFPVGRVYVARAATGTAGSRQLDLPAHVTVSHVIALTL
ncbi:hypothetical protein [Microvirga massiliensis]|uniref:hypothetical protein n=1 Tax=Microvirga massiliensis TaxID=1033741 RepID=UPI0011C75088|nr:hypothetical protein [Microvirga massiliensis]